MHYFTAFVWSMGVFLLDFILFTPRETYNGSISKKKGVQGLFVCFFAL